MALFNYPLYLVISAGDCQGRDWLWVAEQAILGGVDVVQLREKHLSTAEFTVRAQKLQEICTRHSVPLIINDNLPVAQACDAAGLHVGRSDMPPTQVRQVWPQHKLLGYSIEYLQQFDTPEVHAADHLGVSPIFSTPTKTDTVTQWGLAGIAQIKTLTALPLVAIGGVNAHNARAMIDAGAHSVAVVSAICAAADPQRAAAELKQIISA